METFRTELNCPQAPFNLDQGDPVLLVGSCFTEHLGGRLSERKFPVLTNPFGIVYNPESMIRSLERLSDGERPFERADLFEHQGLWHSWEHHGSFSDPDWEAALLRINASYREASLFLKKAEYLILTLGTADVHVLRGSGQVVANNHKMPGEVFGQRRLGAEETAERLAGLLTRLKAQQPALQVILTISPVRHLRLGHVENQRSKSVLVLACADVCARLPWVDYFPAYELLLDDLRDYRFYGPDMVHPSETAVEYIWDVFSRVYFTEATRALNRQMEKVLAAVRHRPFHPDTAAHRAFASGQLQVLKQLEEAHPGLDFSAERAHFEF
jgi:lysophospholipase L1-like esterase